MGVEPFEFMSNGGGGETLPRLVKKRFSLYRENTSRVGVKNSLAFMPGGIAANHESLRDHHKTLAGATALNETGIFYPHETMMENDMNLDL